MSRDDGENESPDPLTNGAGDGGSADRGGSASGRGGPPGDAGDSAASPLAGDADGPDAGLPAEDPDGGPFQRWVQRAIADPRRVYRALFYVVTVFFLLTTLFPFYWLLVLALTPNDAIADMGLLPNGFNPSVFVEIFQQLPFHIYVLNSVVLALATTVIVLVLASLAGYVFGRLEFPGSGPLLLAILAISYFPPAAFLIPLFQLFTGNVEVLGLTSPELYNTPWAMLLPFSALFMPLSIFILTTFYGQIPDGLEDAARVEGTTRLGALFRVIVPLSAPGVATAAVLTFIAVYNEFFFSFLMNSGQVVDTLPMWLRDLVGLQTPQENQWAPLVRGILGFQGQYARFYNLMAAASIVGVLPVAVLVVVAQEKIVSGLTAGALKE